MSGDPAAGQTVKASTSTTEFTRPSEHPITETSAPIPPTQEVSASGQTASNTSQSATTSTDRRGEVSETAPTTILAKSDSGVLGQSQNAGAESAQPVIPQAQDMSAFGQAAANASQLSTAFPAQPERSAETAPRTISLQSNSVTVEPI